MSCIRLSRRPPRPSGLRRALPVLVALAGLGSACSQKQPADGVHMHPVELAAGDFVRAEVEQRADVRVELLDPDGREILHVDGPNRTEDDEEIAAVAEQAGLYQLRVRGCPASAPAAECYTLRLDPPRPATETDPRRAEAIRTTQAAVDAMAVGNIKVQLVSREQALTLWRGLGDRRREAEELYQLGAVHLHLRQYPPAARRLHEAAATWAALGDTDREAKALNDAGRACEGTGHTDEAFKDYQQALAKAQRSGNLRQQGNSLNNIGLLRNRLGERQEALVLLKEALSLARKAEDEASQANILNSLGTTYDDLGEPQKALDLYKQALAVPAARSNDKAAAYNNLGVVHTALGNWEEAAENFNRAIALNRQLDDPYSLASTLNNLGRAQHYAGEVEAARASYEEALALARKEGNRDTEIVAASNFAFLLQEKLGQPDKARIQWQEVARLAANHPVLDYVGLNARAMVERGEKRFGEARVTLQEAISLARRKAELRFAADLTLQLARMERNLGNLQVAAEHARTAIQGIESQRNRVLTADQRALFLASRQSFYTTYIDILMDLGDDTRAFEVSEQARARSLLDLLGESRAGLRRDVPPELLEREQQVRANLRELDFLHMELIHRGAPPEQIALATRRLSAALDEADEVESALRASSESYAALTQPQLLRVRDIQKQILNDRTLLLEYSLGEERSYLWAITAGTFESFELPGRKAIETAALDFYSSVTARNEPEGTVSPVQADARAEQASLTLSRAILAPIEKLLGDRILLVVSDGVLQYVPFAALPLPSAPQERVLARNQVVSLPSASTLAALRRQIEGRTPAAKTLAVLADPVFPGDPRAARFAKAKAKEPGTRVASTRRGLPPRGPGGPSDQLNLEPLPFSREEAKNILKLVQPAGQKLEALDFAASYAMATSGELAKYRYVHFATHGLIDSRQPKLSKLALSQFDATGNPQDGFLRLSDIYNLDLNADLVALSACQTALGQEVQGEGLVGLTRGFMYAGSSRVLASLWSVEDRATAHLMKSFYRHLLTEKRPAAEALRLAQREMASRPQYRSPYFWAGFSLQGEWK
jgi:CHAT domain-containing protein/tetratricopeptide (TPR) repeat protein